MVHWHITFAVFYLVQVAVSGAVPSDPPKCNYPGKAFTDKNRKRIYDAVVGTTGGSKELDYNCPLEEKALLFLKGGEAEPPLIEMKYENDRSHHHSAASFFKDAVKS
ncbi:hypothetical protein Aduo_014486 [Ancylostoma duodenale]